MGLLKAIKTDTASIAIFNFAERSAKQNDRAERSAKQNNRAERSAKQTDRAERSAKSLRPFILFALLIVGTQSAFAMEFDKLTAGMNVLSSRDLSLRGVVMSKSDRVPLLYSQSVTVMKADGSRETVIGNDINHLWESSGCVSSGSPCVGESSFIVKKELEPQSGITVAEALVIGVSGDSVLALEHTSIGGQGVFVGRPAHTRHANALNANDDPEGSQR